MISPLGEARRGMQRTLLHYFLELLFESIITPKQV
jgi:hypothetical protein